MDAPLSAVDVLNSLGQSTQQKETPQILPETSASSVAHLDTSQMQLTMSQVQPVMTPVPTTGVSHPVADTTRIPTPPVSIQSVTPEVQQIAATPVTTPVKTQFDTLTAQLQQVTPQVQPDQNQQLGQHAQLQSTPEQSLSSLLTPVASPKAPTVTVNSLLKQVTSPNQNLITSSPTLQLPSLLQQQQCFQQQQLLPAETLLQAAQSLQTLQAQAVQMQALQPQVQAAAMQVSAQLQMHAQKLQEQLKKKEQQSQKQDVIQIQPVQLHQQQQQQQQQLQQQQLQQQQLQQQQLQQQQISQGSEVSFADKLKAAAQMEVNQPGLLTKLAQQQNLLTTTAMPQQQQAPVTILPTLPTTGRSTYIWLKNMSSLCEFKITS